MIMRSFAALILFISLHSATPRSHEVSQPKQKQSSSSHQTSYSDQRGTEQSPLVVKTLPSPGTQQEAEQGAQDRKDKATNDRHIVEFTGALVVIGFFQFLVYAYQAKKLRETVKSAAEQAEAMERHIDEAARAANAMETIAATIETGNRACAPISPSL